MNFNYSTFSGYEYRDANKPTVIIQSQNPAGMVTTVTVNKTSNLNGTISVPITVPTGGGTIELELSQPNPVATTTTRTTTRISSATSFKTSFITILICLKFFYLSLNFLP